MMNAAAVLPGSASKAPGLGVYYFPGWKANEPGAPAPEPWQRIKPFKERKPLLGWYEESDATLNQQLQWMSHHGLDYVVFDWLWGPDNHAYLDHAVEAYMRLPDTHGVRFSVLWANHTTYVFSLDQFKALFRYWATQYFKHPEYLRINGKPAVFIFSADVLNKNAKALGLSSAALIDLAEGIAREQGLPGVSFIGGTSGKVQGFDYSAASGYSAWTAYNYHGPATFDFDEQGRRLSHSYAELDRAYQDQWKWMTTESPLPLLVPMTSGWDKRPWGGSSDPRHDLSMSTPQQFERHLRAGQDLIARHPDRTIGLGVICCWNEFGEGSYIEPTQEGGFAWLKAIQKVQRGRKIK